MEKLTIKDLIKFRNKSDKSKINFVNNLNLENKKLNSSSGGDYWISCLSAIRNTFRYNFPNLLDEKISLLEEKLKGNEIKRIKVQYLRNKEILINFKDFDFEYLKPNSKINFLKQSKLNYLMDIQGIKVEVKPCYIFTFTKNKSDEIGGVWFIAKLDGFKISELEMFTELLYRYLVKYYSKDYFVNPDYCYAIDIYKGQELNYTEIQENSHTSLLDLTIDEIKSIQLQLKDK